MNNKNYYTYKSIRDIHRDEINIKRLKDIYRMCLRGDITATYIRDMSGYVEITLYGIKHLKWKIHLLI